MPPRKSPRTRTTPTTTTTTTAVTDAQLKAMIDQGVTAILAARDADRSRNGDDNHTSGTGTRRTERVARDNYTMENQIKFATCTLLGIALTWWNSHVRTVGHDVAYEMTWTDLKNKMTTKYCPRGEIKKLEVELWNLKVKGTDVIGYNQCFQELALMCVRMFPEESDKIKKYVGGLPDMIHGSVMASRPKTMQDAIEMATELMDKKIRFLAERQAENKRKFDNNNLPRDRMWLKLTPLGLVKGRSMLELFHCATSASFTTMDRALQSARTARKSAIRQGIVVILLLLEIKGPSHAMNVGIKGITGVIGRS
ncbi:reverse transcriptase domain-containing protein [Tanacetum coccineum]